MLLLKISTYEFVDDGSLFNDGLNWFIVVDLLLFFIVIGKVLYFFDDDERREFFEFTEPNDYLLLKLHWLSLPPYPEPSYYLSCAI